MIVSEQKRIDEFNSDGIKRIKVVYDEYPSESRMLHQIAKSYPFIDGSDLGKRFDELRIIHRYERIEGYMTSVYYIPEELLFKLTVGFTI